MKSKAYKIIMVALLGFMTISSHAYCVHNNTTGHDTFNGEGNSPTQIQVFDFYWTPRIEAGNYLCNTSNAQGNNDTTTVTIDWVRNSMTGSRTTICTVQVHNVGGHIIILGNATNGIPNFSCHVHRS